MIRSRTYRWLALLPTAGLLIGVPALNGVHRSVMGLPILLVWIVGCVLSTSVVMAVIGALDRRHERAAERDSPSSSRSEDR
jgi:hypothetical protein